jgi:uncharacterized membrane protein YfcA
VRLSGLSFETAIYAIIAVIAAGVIKGLTGFGFSLVSVPVLIVVLGPTTAVPVVILLNAVANVVLFPLVRKAANLKRIVPLIIAGIVTIPLGVLLLLALDTGTVELVAGSVTIFFALAFLAGFQRPVADEKWGFAAAGLISGTLNGLISTGGPPAILFLTNQGVPKKAFRASMLAYFLCLSIVSVPTFLVGGLLSLEVVHYALMLLPAMFLGAFVGSKLLHGLPERTFRVTSLVVVMLAGTLSVLSSLGII